MRGGKDEAAWFRLLAAALLAGRTDLSPWRKSNLLARTIPSRTQPDPAAAAAWLREGLAEAGLPAPSRRPSAAMIDQARRDAEAWRERGVKAVLSGRMGLYNDPNRWPVLFIRGDEGVLKHPLAAVLTSRLPRQLQPRDGWIRAVMAALADQAAQSAGLVGSLNTPGYDLAAYWAGRLGMPRLLVLDRALPFMADQSEIDDFREQYAGFDAPAGRLWVSPFPPGPPPPRKTRLTARDRLVAALADRIVVGRVSENGLMARLAESALGRGRYAAAVRPEADDPGWAGGRRLIGLGAEPLDLPPAAPKLRPPAPQGMEDAFDDASTLPDGAFLFHFTRPRPGPWPGQRLADYYQGLIDGDEDAAHTGFDALCRILSEGRIRGSNQMIRGQTPAVSFSALPLSEFHNLRAWRRTLARWTVSPYGLAISKKRLWQLGGRPAVYGREEDYPRLPQGQRYRFQRKSGAAGNWRREREWRLAGDLDLNRLSAGDLRVMVTSVREAAVAADRFGWRPVLAAFPE